MATPVITYLARGYTTKRLSSVRDNSGKNHFCLASVTAPPGSYYAYVSGILTITEGYSNPKLIGPELCVAISVGGDNPLFAKVANRSWQELYRFNKNGTYRTFGGVDLTLTKSSNTIEAVSGLRDADYPVDPGEGYDDTTILVMQVELHLTLTNV